MAPVDHLEQARAYITGAEDPREGFTCAADEILAWLAEDERRTKRRAAAGVGKSEAWVRDLLRWRTGAMFTSHATPWTNTREERASRGVATPDQSTARRVLREQPEALEDEIVEAYTALAERSMAAAADEREERLADRDPVQRRRDHDERLTDAEAGAVQRALYTITNARRHVLQAIREAERLGAEAWEANPDQRAEAIDQSERIGMAATLLGSIVQGGTRDLDAALAALLAEAQEGGAA